MNIKIFLYIIGICCSFTQTMDFNHDQHTQSKYPLHDAVKSGDLEQVEHILKTELFRIHFQDDQGNTALHIAALWCQFDCASLLLKHGADKTIRNNRHLLPSSLTDEPKLKSVLELETTDEFVFPSIDEEQTRNSSFRRDHPYWTLFGLIGLVVLIYKIKI